MNDKIFSYLSDPIKAKLILEVYRMEQATTTQLAEKFSEIPQATLYRHIKKMLTDGILVVADETPVRGTVEKVYALGFDFEENNGVLMEENDGQVYLQMATLYMLGILDEFKEYAEKKDIDIAGDGSGLSLAPIYATADELAELLKKIGEALLPLMNNTPGDDRKLRNLCIIVTPPKD